MASKKASKSRQRSISDLSPQERQAKGVKGGRVAAAVAKPDVTAGRVVVEKRPGVSAGRLF
jgi:hypothetical protein